MKHGIAALLLAGHRPGPDPICTRHGVVYKSLVPVAGVPMILHPLNTLSGCEYISEVMVMAQEPEKIRAALEGHPYGDNVRFCESKDTIAETVRAALEDAGVDLPLLVTTADNCLLKPRHIADLLSQSAEQYVDVAVGFSRRDSLLARHPGSRRTWLRFKDVEVTGCNLFLLKSQRVINAIRFWKEFESRPKKTLEMAWRLGPAFFWRYWRGRITIRDSFERISGLAGASIKPVLLTSPEVAIDADKPGDIRQIESIMLSGAGPDPAILHWPVRARPLRSQGASYPAPGLSENV